MAADRLVGAERLPAMSALAGNPEPGEVSNGALRAAAREHGGTIADESGVDGEAVLIKAAGLAALSDDPPSAASLRTTQKPVRAPRIAHDADPFADRWFTLSDDWLEQEPPPQHFVVRYPSGRGMIPLGIAALLAGAGGIGKTEALVDLAIAVLTGGAWFDHFPVDSGARGKVLLLAAEEDEPEMRRRIHRATRRLTPEQRAMVRGRLVVVPMHGRDVAMLAKTSARDSAQRTAFLAALRARCEREAGTEGWTLIAVGPLSRIAGVPLDADNTNATAIVQAMESLTELPGNPTVLVDCHTNAESRKKGDASVRGPTALVDGVRWWASLHRTERGKPVEFVARKTNRGPEDDTPVLLDRGSDGLLRARTAVPVGETDREQRERAELRERAAAREQEVVSILTEMGGTCRGAEPIYARMAGKSEAKRAALKACIGRTVGERGASNRREYFLLDISAPEGCVRVPPTPPSPRGEGEKPSPVSPSSRRTREGARRGEGEKNTPQVASDVARGAP